VSLPSRCSTLTITVEDVIGFGAEKEMQRITARRIITSMQDAQTGWDGTDGQDPRNSMRPILFAIDINCAMSEMESATFP